jgi:catechol 2,3-dioxygenase-like lactoylglutathione lyase family enzyme
MSKRNVVHIEIPAANVEAAGKFYQDLFGWKMQNVPEFDYTMWEDGSGYGDAWGYMCGEWLPKSGYQPADRAPFERYTGDGDNGAECVDVCVPVIPM